MDATPITLIDLFEIGEPKSKTIRDYQLTAKVAEILILASQIAVLVLLYRFVHL